MFNINKQTLLLLSKIIFIKIFIIFSGPGVEIYAREIQRNKIVKKERIEDFPRYIKFSLNRYFESKSTLNVYPSKLL